MAELTKEQLKKAIKEVWIRSLTEIQPDILQALESWWKTQRSPPATTR